MRPVFLDVEATGVEEEDRVCQVAYKIDGEMKCETFRPPLPIKIDAMAVHHITNRMVESKPSFAQSQMWNQLKDLLESDDAVFVAHNAAFDSDMLRREGINVKNLICTLKLSRYLDREAKLQRHNLQYLRYLLDLDVEAQAHDAAGDVLVLEKLFDRLYRQFSVDSGADSPEQVYREMVAVSARPSMIRRFTFGKHNGKRVEEVLNQDRGYLEWLLLQKRQDPQGEEDWIYTLEQLLA